MELYLYSFTFKRGGAGFAADKFKILAKKLKFEPVLGISQDNASSFQFFKRLISFFLSKFLVDNNPIKHSLNLFSCNSVLKAFKDTEALHHIHWINNDTLSIFDFNKIPKGAIITLHDEWLYCGAEHCYDVNDNFFYFINGYKFFKKEWNGFNWNYIIWKIKFNKLSKRRDLIFTVPSNWMLERAKKSLILKNADVRLLPNPIDTKLFRPMKDEKRFFDIDRTQFEFGKDEFIICFGAIVGINNYYKGSKLLEEAMNILRNSIDKEKSKKIKILTFGGKKEEASIKNGFETFSIGHINKPQQLVTLYSNVDCVIVPSLVESFGQVAAEALACETPVICFDCSGLRDIVKDGVTGLLAKKYDANDLALKIEIMFKKDALERLQLGQNGRKHIVKNFSFEVIQNKYGDILNDALILARDSK